MRAAARVRAARGPCGGNADQPPNRPPSRPHGGATGGTGHDAPVTDSPVRLQPSRRRAHGLARGRLREQLRETTERTTCHPDYMTPSPAPRLPRDGWQQELLPLLTELASEDGRVSDLRAHGSANGIAATVDQWSDLDILITTTDPAGSAESLARRIRDRVAPVFAASRDGNDRGYCVRLVLSDLRRIDISAAPPVPSSGTAQSSEPGQRQDPAGAVAGIVASFRFDAVLAAVRAARGDILIGAHLTLQLARHVLVIAMLLRDRDAGTDHHRHGGSRWDQWAARLADAPAPYSTTGITTAIRFYAAALDEILACWDPGTPLDNGPLLDLLSAIDLAADEAAQAG